jgi:hypothetical protein
VSRQFNFVLSGDQAATTITAEPAARPGLTQESLSIRGKRVSSAGPSAVNLRS